MLKHNNPGPESMHRPSSLSTTEKTNMRTNTPARLAATAAAIAVLTTASGCLVSGSSSTAVSGNPISEQTLTQIQPGLTTRAQVLSLLGTPNRTTTINDATVLVYSYSKRTNSESKVFLIFSGDNTKAVSSTTYIELNDQDLVTNIWTDTSTS